VFESFDEADVALCGLAIFRSPARPEKVVSPDPS